MIEKSKAKANIAAGNDLRDRLIKGSTQKLSSPLSESVVFNNKDVIQTSVPMVNVALSGRLDGGLTPGLTVFAGPSKHFKTAFVMLLAKSYLDKYPDAVVLFYDSEFGAPEGYFKSFDIDTSRIIHTPVANIEEFKHDIMNQLGNIQRGDRVFIMLDSIGNLASTKEIDDALEGKSVADFTRAKMLKGAFRMIQPQLTIKDIPMVAVAHTYQTMSLYPTEVMSGGRGAYYAGDNIFMIGRQQEKDESEVVGYTFVMNVEKSRFVKEKSKIPIRVLFEGGIGRWSGLLEMALESGHVLNPSKGWYQRKGTEEKVRESNTNNASFWLPILQDREFQNWIQSKFRISEHSIVSDLTDEDIAQEIGTND